MRSEVLLAVISKVVEARVVDLQEFASSRRGPRGVAGNDGPQGIAGTSFQWAEHELEIRNLIRESAFKYSDFTEEQLESFRGPRGREGKDGNHGNDFDFDTHRNDIVEIVYRELKAMSDDLKIKFSDLTSEDLDLIRGPRGQKGKSGKDFVFEEHREYFDSLKLKFSDFTEEDVSQLRLKFADLTAEEIGELKLEFSDLTADDISLIRGPRGQRGRPGIDGENGKDGQSIVGAIGPRGTIGPAGLRGFPGLDGIQGDRGDDAPEITEVKIEEYPGKELSLKLYLSDGSLIESNRIKLPDGTLIAQNIAIAVSSSAVTTVPKLVVTFDTDIGTLATHLVVVTGTNVVQGITDNDAFTIPNGVFGVGLSKPSGTSIEVLFAGVVGGYSGFTVGLPLFISSLGVPTHTPPGTGMVQQIGFAVSPTELFVSLMQPMRRS